MVVTDRDLGSVTIVSVDYATDPPSLSPRATLDLGAGSEPWQAVVSPDGTEAYVVLRHDQKVVKITGLDTASPAVGASVAVGSEPTGIAITPTGSRLWVTNWVDGTVNGINPTNMTVTSTIDLNTALVATGHLGNITPRPALAHPRSIVITNNGDTDNTDETMLITEYFGQRIAPDTNTTPGDQADVAKAGIVYKIPLSDTTNITTIELAPLTDIGFTDANGGLAGCFPNQVQSINVSGANAYVVSVCASPRGPIGPKVNTSPVVHVFDIATGAQLSATNLNKSFDSFYVAGSVPDTDARRMPLVANDIAFVPGTTIGYLSANGADAVFRTFYAADGTLGAVGSNTQSFIDLNLAGLPAGTAGLNPLGINVSNQSHGGKTFAFTANDVSRNLSVIDLSSQTVAGAPAAPAVISTAALPAAGSDEEKRLHGRRFFNTGTGRWSLNGQAWGSCQSCHIDGLTDNVTWYFARGPRQSTSVDGSYSPSGKRRIFNWTAIFDEMADFEGNTRGVSGGVGAVVKATSTPPVNGDRIDPAPTHAGLNGSITLLADASNPLNLAPGSQCVIDNWADLTKYTENIRAPRGASNVDAAKVSAGRALFNTGNCQGCHGGDNWTISEVFYTPNSTSGAGTVNTALRSLPWTVPGTFPAALLPATGANQTMRYNGAAAANFDQLRCILRPVGTFGVGEPEVGVTEVRADMSTAAQGNEAEGKGYNPPSLLGLNAGGPFLHAGNVRTLEAMFDPNSAAFATHYRSLSPNLLIGASAAADRDALIQFLISIDDDTAPFTIPAVGSTGGNFCSAP